MITYEGPTPGHEADDLAEIVCVVPRRASRVPVVSVMTPPQLRRATESDIEFLADVVLLSSEDRYRRHPGWDRDGFRAGLVDDAADQVAGGPENSITYVIVVDGIDVGRARLVTTAEQVEIAGLQVLPEYQNRGTGTAVIDQVINTAASAGLPVVLDVETDNPNACRLYERLGFRPTGPVIKDRQTMILQTDRSSPTRGSQAWQSAVEQWTQDQLTSLGHPPTGAMTVVSAQAWSTVWRVPTTDSSVIVKQSTQARRREADIIAFAARLAPDQIDPPLAADTAKGRMILSDAGPTLYDTNPETRGLDLDTVLALIADFARLQQATIGHDSEAADAGLTRWDPALAADDAEQQASSLHELPSDDPRHITADQLHRIRLCLPDIARAGRQVASSPVPHCLDHGDLWPRNVIPDQTRRRFRYIDFGDAAWTHPFLSLPMMIVECRYRWSVPDRPDGLNLDDPILHRILDSYLNTWTTYAPISDLRETLRNALRIAPLRHSRAWITNLTEADDQTRTDHGAMPWAWLEDLTIPVLL